MKSARDFIYTCSEIVPDTAYHEFQLRDDIYKRLFQHIASEAIKRRVEVSHPPGYVKYVAEVLIIDPTSFWEIVRHEAEQLTKAY